jgi:pyruvate-formate lyase
MGKRDFSRESRFTSVHQQHRHSHPAIREAKCLEAEYPAYLADIRPGDLFAGRADQGRVGFSIDEWGPTAFGYYCQFELIEADLAGGEYTDAEKADILRIMEYWREEDTSMKVRKAYPEHLASWLPSDGWMHESGVAFPLYRLTGGTPDFHRLMRLGIPGLYDEIESRRRQLTPGSEQEPFFEGMKLALDTLVGVCRHYEEQARRMAALSRNTADSLELRRIADALLAITLARPERLREGMQLFWLFTLVSDIRNYGRMDVYFGDLLAQDIREGILDEAEALRLTCGLWQLMADRRTIVHNRVIVGGRGRPNVENADRFALLAMEASRTVLEIEPQLSLRIHDGINPELIEKAIQVIGEGRTFPILYNDEVNVPSVKAAFGFTDGEAEQYVPYGCGEYILEHRSFGTPSGVINLLKALELTLHNGVDPVTGKKAGLALGELRDFTTFDALFAAYRRQVEHFVGLLAEQEALEYRIAGEAAPFLYASLLYDDCLERGKGLFQGGVRYLGGTIETYGNSNASDSLLAIKKLVYESAAIRPDDLIAALDADFAGYSGLRKKLLAAPKYGNDDPEADAMLARVHDHVCNFARAQAGRVGLHSYLVVIINNSANTLMGHATGASADGRLSGTHMNNGNAPSGGSDREGLTALINSIVKPDTAIHAGAVQNMKFSKEIFSRHPEIVHSLLDTYFDKGGAQAMITVLNRHDLEQALAHPEKYPNLFVRVGGFSARFVELSPDVQEDIVSRTLYS